MLQSINVLDHIAVTVSDLERSLAFYRDLLGLKEVERHLLEGEVEVSSHQVRLALLRGSMTLTCPWHLSC